MTTDISVPLAALLPAAITTALPSSLPSTLPAALTTAKVRTRPLTNTFTVSRFGRYIPRTASTTIETHTSIQEVMADSFYGFQVILPNNGPAIAGCTVQVCVASAIGADNVVPITPTGGTWTNATLNGSTTINIAAQIANEVPSYTILDVSPLRSLARTDSGTKAIVCVRIQFPTTISPMIPANNTYYWATSGQAQPILKGSYQAVAGITTPANYTTTTVSYDSVFHPAIRYFSPRAGKLVMVNGDSTVEGIGGDIRAFGAVQRACAALSSPTAPVEWFNAALHAQTPATYSQMVSNHLDKVNPTALFYAPYSINNTYTSSTVTAILQEDYTALSRVLSTVSLKTAPPALYFLEGAPTNTAYRALGAYDTTVRRFMNSEAALLTNNYGGVAVVPGYQAAVAGADDGSGQIQIASGMASSDNVHFSNAGYVALQAVVQPTVAAL